LGTLIIRQERKAGVQYYISKAAQVIANFYKNKAKAMTIPPDLAKETIKYAELLPGDFIKQITELEKSLKEASSHIIAQKALELVEKHWKEISSAHSVDAPSPDGPALVVVVTTLADLEIIVRNLRMLTKEEIVDLTTWRRVKYNDLIKEKCGADWFTISAAERRQKAHDMGAEIGKEFEDFEVTNAVFSKFIEPTLINPTFVTHLPKELVPLAKLSPDDPTTVEVFECCINGQEISPGYTEQNDPIQQRATLEHQAGGEQQKLDEDFLIALEHGMPPAGGIGIGIDRLCMMLLGQESIRDVILFPQLKPK
jgi:hypothetical protein